MTLELGLLGWRAGPDLPRQFELKCPPQLVIYRGGYIKLPASLICINWDGYYKSARLG